MNDERADCDNKEMHMTF